MGNSKQSYIGTHDLIGKKKKTFTGENLMTPRSKSNCQGCCKDAQNLWRYPQNMCLLKRNVRFLTVYKKCSSHHHLPAKAGLIFKKPHITHDAVLMTHAMTSESALSKMQVHQGQRGQVAPLSPQSPRPLMLTWEPAQVLCCSPGKLRLRIAQ